MQLGGDSVPSPCSNFPIPLLPQKRLVCVCLPLSSPPCALVCRRSNIGVLCPGNLCRTCTLPTSIVL